MGGSFLWGAQSPLVWLLFRPAFYIWPPVLQERCIHLTVVDPSGVQIGGNLGGGFLQGPQPFGEFGRAPGRLFHFRRGTARQGQQRKYVRRIPRHGPPPATHGGRRRQSEPAGCGAGCCNAPAASTGHGWACPASAAPASGTGRTRERRPAPCVSQCLILLRPRR